MAFENMVVDVLSSVVNKIKEQFQKISTPRKKHCI